MKIKIWGSRGSIPSPCRGTSITEKVTRALELSLEAGLTRDGIDSFVDSLPFWIRSCYGGNTPCVQFLSGSEYLVADLGTGARCLGNEILAGAGPGPHVFHILLSHLHWDHIQGFPFFPFIYIPGNIINIYGAHENLEQAFQVQQSSPFFPVSFKDLPADIRFHVLTPGQTVSMAGFDVSAHEQPHPGKSYGYLIRQGDKSVVYSTDCEYDDVEAASIDRFRAMARDADLVILDSQYTFADHHMSKKDWGHSSNVVGVELCKNAGVKKLCLFHLDPFLDDQSLDKYLQDTKSYSELYSPELPLDIFMAYDGLELDI